MDSVVCVAWKTATVALLVSGLMWLAQKGCAPEPDMTPRPVYELLRADTPDAPAAAEGRARDRRSGMAGMATNVVASPLRPVRESAAAEQDDRGLRA